MFITDMKGSGRGLVVSHARVLVSGAEKTRNIRHFRLSPVPEVKSWTFLIRSWDIKASFVKGVSFKTTN
jgi:hypothetical protein